MNQIVVNYVLPDGSEPIVEWLEALQDIKARAKIRARINQLRVGNKMMLLLCGGDKSTQRADIKTATEYLGDYKRRIKEYD